MSTLSEEARAKAKSKAERLVRADPNVRVDASGYRPDGAMDADVQTGPRPVSRRQYRRGGGVAGEASAPRADRKPRAAGGRTKVDGGLINEDVKEANEERAGTKHIGGMKGGGRTAKMVGGALSSQQRMALQKRRSAIPGAALPRPMRNAGGGTHAAGCECGKCGGGRVGRKDGGAINDGTRPTGGRLARKGGGRTKKGTNVNIVITQPPSNAPVGMRPPMPVVPGPTGMRQGVPPPVPTTASAAPGPMPPPAAQAPAGLPMRAAGGSVKPVSTSVPTRKPGAYPLTSGSGGGLGRLEKARRA